MTFYTHTSSDGLRETASHAVVRTPSDDRSNLKKKKGTDLHCELSTTKTPASLPNSFLNKASGLVEQDRALYLNRL